MSLVGSEVDVSVTSVDTDRVFRPLVSDDELSSHSVPQQDTREAVLGAVAVDYHPPVSPPRGSEVLFLSNLETQNISAAALAQQIHQTHRLSSIGTSVATDDFATALPFVEDFDDDFSDSRQRARSSDTLSPIAAEDELNLSDSHQFFPKDVLSRNYSVPTQEVFFHDSNMTSTTKKSSKTTSTKFVPTEAPTHVDAAEKVYETAKGLWAWGKGVMVVSPFLGLAENVAGKAVGMTGNNLEGLDGAVVDQLHGIDDKILNPAITALVGALLGVAGSAEESMKPIIVSILKPLGLIKEDAENPEVTVTPGVTVQ